MRIYLRAYVVVAGLTGFGFLLPAHAGDQPANPAPAKPALKVKVFKLERAEPDSVMQTMRDLLEEQDMEPPVPQPQQVPLILVPGLGIQFGNPVFGPGFPMGVPPADLIPRWRIASDERTGAVVVRGSETHLKVAADLVAILDRKPNTAIPKLQVVKAFPLKHAEPDAIVNVIRSLDLDDVRMSSLDDKTLLVIGPDEATKDIGELVKELDVPTRPEPKDKALPKPRLGPPAGM